MLDPFRFIMIIIKTSNSPLKPTVSVLECASIRSVEQVELLANFSGSRTPCVYLDYLVVGPAQKKEDFFLRKLSICSSIS